MRPVTINEDCISVIVAKNTTLSKSARKWNLRFPLGGANPPGSLTRSCPTWGRSEHLRETVSMAHSGRRNLLPPSGAWNQKSLRVWNLPGVYTPRRVGSQILLLRFPHFLLASTQNSKDLEKSTNSCDLSARTAIGGPKELSPYISSDCSL